MKKAKILLLAILCLSFAGSAFVRNFEHPSATLLAGQFISFQVVGDLAYGIGAPAYASISSGRETLYPSGYDITCKYELSAKYPGISDTLIITRTVSNSEPFGLSGMYLAENLPSEFVIVSSNVAIDGVPISFYYSGALPDQMIRGFDTYRWVLGFPGEPGPFDNIVETGQVLSLQYEILFEAPGDYTLPFHTVCFYGDGSGFFTTSDTLFVFVQEENDVPTLSQWGMLIMALLILAMGTVAAARRRRTAIA